MARFSGCKFCWVPQSICQRWEEKTAARGAKTAGYQRSRAAGAGCQYRGVIEEIGGAVISQKMGTREEGDGREWEWVEGEMERTISFWEGGGRKEEGGATLEVGDPKESDEYDGNKRAGQDGVSCKLR